MTASSRSDPGLAGRRDPQPARLPAASGAWRPTRRTGTALVAFGVAGLVLLATCLVAAVAFLVPLLGAAASFDQQRAAAAELIGPAADTLDATATSAEHAGASFGQSVAAARDASSVTGQLADAMEGLAAFSSAFADTANRSRALSQDLASTAASLSQNQTDSATTAGQLRALADRVRQLGERLGSAGGPATNVLAGVAVPLGTGLVILLLAWLAAIAGASVWLGRRLRSADGPG